MALINCRECNHTVSDKALDCPSCGAKLRKPTRGFFGKIFKWLFILFNLFMLVMTFKSCGTASEVIISSQNEYEQAGATLGTTLGLGMIITFWALVDVILGLFVLFTRPKN
ncbi:hypothetical protein OQH06_18555 [Acinetobacter baumannii]|nr:MULTISPECIES: hypothetical protein [Acinetobacter calcoaceticus/baumannii complex]KRI80990.1 hypothetical protein APC68_05395 [Acinetobacter pittii]KRJ67191.1 hypothetical protein APC92_08145 [Acinetobacter pittii]MCJ8819776.1 hypothetical protein [Acinetobacter baumannii]MCJ8988084.1 hypothetical protein [Acinetobacter baumannii]MCJ8992047.1 hypothetical protein [Acinetobacter baumannii]